MDEFYKNKLHLLTGENNPKREANLYRGLGYSYVFNERFDEGEESFLKAIHILYDMRTADEVAETLYNIVIARICVQDYKTAGVLCRHMFGMLDNLNRKTIARCSQSKLLSLRAICSYMMGNEYKSYGDLKKIRKLMELKKYGNGEERNSDDVFLYELIEALFSTKIGEYEEARYHFEKARDIFSNLSTAVFYALVLFYTEYYSLLVKVGDKKKSAELMVEAMHCCEKHGFEKMADTIKNKIDGKEYICIKKKNPIDDAMAEKLLDLSVNVGRENTIIKQKKQIWFLSLWQEMLNREWIDKKVLLHETLNLFQDSFNLDRMLYVSIDGGNIRKEYSNFKVDKSKFAAIRDYFEEEKMSFLISRTNSRFSFFKPIFEMLESEEVYTLIGIPVYIDNTLVGIFVGSVLDRDNDVSVLTYDDLTIMKTAVMQAYNTLERIGTRVNLVKTNEKLSELAITDQLTGLYNRQGAVRVIEKLSKIQHEIPVLGIDLDNFKYYNDTFGHEMGDMILSNFAAILNRVTREDDYVIRYGGDEFVILFSNGDVEVAKKVASRIYDAMESDLHEKVIDAIGKDKIIPNDKKLSCSIGIAVAKDSRRSSIHEALIRADEALYDIKKAGKGDFCVWCEKMGGGSACTPLRNLVGK